MHAEFRAFVDKWSVPGHPSEPQTAEMISALETEFGVLLPETYFKFMLGVGRLWVPHILSSVVEFEVPLPSLQDFLSSTEAIEITRNWRAASLPLDLVAFANDASGNLFCFNQELCSHIRLQDAPVMFWDHDFNETSEVAPSLLSFLEQYVRLEKVIG